MILTGCSPGTHFTETTTLDQWRRAGVYRSKIYGSVSRAGAHYYFRKRSGYTKQDQEYMDD